MRRTGYGIAATLLAAGMLMAQKRPDYPPARLADQIDDYHGDKIADPYRWLEDSDSPETRAWIEAENKLTFSYLDSIPERPAVHRLLTRFYDFERFGAPLEVAGRVFYTHNTGLQNQSVFFAQSGVSAKGMEFLDPNKLSAKGTVAVDGFIPSHDAALVAYALAEAGSDWTVWKVRDVRTGKDLPDTLRWIKFSGVTWSLDNKGFWYSRYPEPKDKALTQANENNRLFYHRLGDDQLKDTLVYERPDKPAWMFGADVTDDGRWLLISTAEGASNDNGLYYLDLKKPGAKPVPLVDRIDASFQLLGSEGSTLILFTNEKAPKGRIIAVDLTKPEPASWRTIVPEQTDLMESALMAGGKLLASYLHDAHSAAKLYSLEGKPLGDIKLPGLGHADWSHYSQNDKAVFFTWSEYTRPASLWRVDMATGQPVLFKESKIPFDPARYETLQEFYTSKDGTRVPMFIIQRKGTVRNGQNPTILYGYGGFNIALTPAYAPRIMTWLEMGGVYAIANLRGGSEYGEEWHKAGTKLRKQNVFDDFIAGAEYLIAQKVTSTPKLAIEGRSNGGLLIGAVLNQRPDLFGAALPGVGVMDMLRFQKFTIGRAWVSDYGSSDDPEEYKAIRAYSPLHNIKPGVKYPPMLIVTADHDDRVVPGHSFKYVATMQHAQGGEAPVLIRIETDAGHGGGKPVSKSIGEAGDEYAFLAHALGMKLPANQ